MLLLDLADLLITPALTPVAAVAGTTLVVGRLPESPDTLYALVDYGGRPPERTHNGHVRRFTRFQVVCRNPDPLVARQMADAVYVRFSSFIQADLGSPAVTYETIRPLAEPFDLHSDSSFRANIACNYEVWTEL